MEVIHSPTRRRDRNQKKDLYNSHNKDDAQFENWVTLWIYMKFEDMISHCCWIRCFYNWLYSELTNSVKLNHLWSNLRYWFGNKCRHFKFSSKLDMCWFYRGWFIRSASFSRGINLWACMETKKESLHWWTRSWTW